MGAYLERTARAKIEAINAGAQMGAILLDAVDGKHADTRASRLAHYAGQVAYVATGLNCG